LERAAVKPTRDGCDRSWLSCSKRDPKRLLSDLLREAAGIVPASLRSSTELIPHAGKRWMSAVFDLDPASTTKGITRNERSHSNQRQRVHIAAARSSLRTRNENAASCIRLCIARPSHLDRTKFIRNFSRIGDQCSRSIQQASSIRSSETREANGNGPSRWAARKRSNRAKPRARAPLYLKYGPQLIARTAGRAGNPD
jgi:hypothetical protein